MHQLGDFKRGLYTFRARTTRLRRGQAQTEVGLGLRTPNTRSKVQEFHSKAGSQLAVQAWGRMGRGWGAREVLQTRWLSGSFHSAREGLEFKDCSALAPTVLAPPPHPIPAARLCCKVYFF